MHTIICVTVRGPLSFFPTSSRFCHSGGGYYIDAYTYVYICLFICIYKCECENDIDICSRAGSSFCRSLLLRLVPAILEVNST